MKNVIIILLVFYWENTGLAQPQASAAGPQSMNPDLAAILDLAGGWQSRGHPGTVGGHDPQGNGFTLQALELALGAAVDPYFRFDANMVLGGPGGAELEEAYATTLGLPAGLQVRAGQFLTRFGRLNQTHPHTWHFVDAPLVNGAFLGEDGQRGAGGELSWLLPLPWYLEVVGSATGPDLGALADETAPAVESARDLVYTTALKQFFALSDDWSLLWGLSGQFSPVTAGSGDRCLVAGTDLFLEWKPVDSPERAAVSLQVEALGRRRTLGGTTLDDWGGYAELVWRPWLRWETGLRGDLLRVVDRGPAGFTAAADLLDRERGTAQLTFYPSHFSRLRLQGSLERRQDADGPAWSVWLALEVLVGAHGAHSY